MNTPSTQSAETGVSETAYFDLHVNGCGYLNRVREAPAGRRGDTFLACAISAVYGPCEAPTYSYFDLKVVGEEAQSLIRRCWNAANDPKRSVFIAFRAGDIYAEHYEADEKDRMTKAKTGKKIHRATIKGRLLKIMHIKVDDKVVFEAEKAEKPTLSETGDVTQEPNS